LARQPGDYQLFHRRNDLNRLFCAQPFGQCGQNPGVWMPSMRGGGIYHTCGGKETTAAHGSINLVLSSLSLTQ